MFPLLYISTGTDMLIAYFVHQECVNQATHLLSRLLMVDVIFELLSTLTNTQKNLIKVSFV